MTLATMPWTGSLPTEDTHLHVRDSGGGGRPVVYVNGGFADHTHWRRVIADLGPQFRHVAFDGRARGRSGTSSDTSFAAFVRDIGAVIRERGLRRPILVGWSNGASLAAQYAVDHPAVVSGLVLVDGAMPYGLTGPEGEEQIRRLFSRFRWFLPVAARFGLAGRMSWQAHAQSDIEQNRIFANCAPVLEAIGCPTRYVLASGGNLGASAEVMAAVRASLAPVLQRNPHLAVSAQVGSNHSTILARDHDAIARAVREIVTIDGRG